MRYTTKGFKEGYDSFVSHRSISIPPWNQCKDWPSELPCCLYHRGYARAYIDFVAKLPVENINNHEIFNP